MREMIHLKNERSKNIDWIGDKMEKKKTGSRTLYTLLIILAGGIFILGTFIFYSGIAALIWIFYELLTMESVYPLPDINILLTTTLIIIGFIILFVEIVITVGVAIFVNQKMKKTERISKQ